MPRRVGGVRRRGVVGWRHRGVHLHILSWEPCVTVSLHEELQSLQLVLCSVPKRCSRPGVGRLCDATVDFAGIFNGRLADFQVNPLRQPKLCGSIIYTTRLCSPERSPRRCGAAARPPRPAAMRRAGGYAGVRRGELGPADLGRRRRRLKRCPGRGPDLCEAVFGGGPRDVGNKAGFRGNHRAAGRETPAALAALQSPSPRATAISTRRSGWATCRPMSKRATRGDPRLHRYHPRFEVGAERQHRLRRV